MSLHNLEEYRDVVSRSIRESRRVPPPATIDELRFLIDEYPDEALGFLPSAAELTRLGISRYACRPVPPFRLEFCERFIATISADADFRAALASMLGGRA